MHYGTFSTDEEQTKHILSYLVVKWIKVLIANSWIL